MTASWGWRKGSLVLSRSRLPKNPDLIPNTYTVAHTISLFSSKESNAFFWPLRSLHTYGTQTQTQAKYPYVYTVLKNYQTKGYSLVTELRNIQEPDPGQQEDPRMAALPSFPILKFLTKLSLWVKNSC